MSKRHFCDLCDAPAVDGLHAKSTELPVGEPVREYRSHRSGGGTEGLYQTYAIASVHFSFRDHKTGFGGPPDLCRACASKLVKQLLEKINAEAAP